MTFFQAEEGLFGTWSRANLERFLTVIRVLDDGLRLEVLIQRVVAGQFDGR
jgi:hypothetical protein